MQLPLSLCRNWMKKVCDPPKECDIQKQTSLYCHTRSQACWKKLWFKPTDIHVRSWFNKQKHKLVNLQSSVFEFGLSMWANLRDQACTQPDTTFLLEAALIVVWPLNHLFLKKLVNTGSGPHTLWYRSGKSAHVMDIKFA